jgi:3-hydroxybutyryl-CoA dehydratase
MKRFCSMDATELGLARVLHMKRRKSGKPDLRVKPGHDELEHAPGRRIPRPDGACEKSGLRSRRMILALRILYFEDLSVGMTETLSKTIASSDVVGFAQLTGDRNPIHLSEHFAAKTQFGKRIAHGLYTASLISAVLGTRLPGPGAVYISQTLNFRAPVKIGDQVDVTVTVAELIPDRQRARLACSCKVGEEIVLDGEAWVKVPSAAKSKRPLPRV